MVVDVDDVVLMNYVWLCCHRQKFVDRAGKQTSQGALLPVESESFSAPRGAQQQNCAVFTANKVFYYRLHLLRVELALRVLLTVNLVKLVCRHVIG